MNQTPSSQRPPSLLWLALLITMLIALWLQGPHLFDPYVTDWDFRTYYYMHRFQDRELFQDDYYIEQAGRYVEVKVGSLELIVDNASPGYSLLFWLASYFISLILFNKLLVFPLLGISVFYLYRIGDHLRGPAAGLFLAVAFAILNPASSWSVTVFGGLQRSFIFPLLIPLVYYLLIGRNRAAAVIVFISGLIYPPIFVLNAATYALSLIRWADPRRWQPTIQWRQAIPLLIAVLSVVLVLIPVLIARLSQSTLIAGSTVGHMLNDPIFQAGGRRNLFDVFPFVGRAGPFTNTVMASYVLILALLAGAVTLLQPAKLRPFPHVLKSLFFAAWLSFTLSWLAIVILSSLALYLPSRYVEAPLFLILLIFIAANGGPALQQAAALIRIHKKEMAWAIIPVVGIVATLLLFPDVSSLGELSSGLRWVLLVLLGLLLLLYALSLRAENSENSGKDVQPLSSHRLWMAVSFLSLLVAFFFVHFFQVPPHRILPAEQELFSYLESLPKDIRLAGHPCLLDNVPLFAKRTALSTCEIMNQEPGVVLAMLRAYYSENSHEIVRFCQEYKIDYLVVNTHFLQPEFLNQDFIFFEPYNAILLAELNPEGNFVLDSIPSERKDFERGPLFVIKCEADIFN